MWPHINLVAILAFMPFSFAHPLWIPAAGNSLDLESLATTVSSVDDYLPIFQEWMDLGEFKSSSMA